MSWVRRGAYKVMRLMPGLATARLLSRVPVSYKITERITTTLMKTALDTRCRISRELAITLCASAGRTGTMPDLHRAVWNRSWTFDTLRH